MLDRRSFIGLAAAMLAAGGGARRGQRGAVSQWRRCRAGRHRHEPGLAGRPRRRPVRRRLLRLRRGARGRRARRAVRAPRRDRRLAARALDAGRASIRTRPWRPVAVNATLDDIRGVLIRVGATQLLLPNATISEVLSYSPPEPVEDAPDWLLGRLRWRGRAVRLPGERKSRCFSLQTYRQLPQMSGQNRHSCGSCGGWPPAFSPRMGRQIRSCSPVLSA